MDLYSMLLTVPYKNIAYTRVSAGVYTVGYNSSENLKFPYFDIIANF
jgi:hypothetical protein